MYLKCSSNNQAATVYCTFLKAVQKYQIPSRVRSDQGVENIKVAQYMLEKRGADRKSIITGCSVHNQRIERLWRGYAQKCHNFVLDRCLRHRGGEPDQAPEFHVGAYFV